MLPVPDEFRESVDKASSMLAEGAKLAMFIALMLDSEKYELDTVDGYRIIITKIPDSELVAIRI